MPTPVATAKQCLTAEAAHALDAAVAVARGRRHNQTTSLHALSAFLSLSSSPFRDACFRARNAAFGYYPSPRSQLRALHSALSLSLDRSPSSQHHVHDPPISNSLMAAIKRSQAAQRRQPDGLLPKQDHGKETEIGVSGIRVEIHYLILAILDDPIVSRVFFEAGFSSFDVKLAMLKPFQSFWRYDSCIPFQKQHMSLLNQEDNFNPGFRAFQFPFPGDSYGDEEFRRIADVLAGRKGKNPLLFGVCAYGALQCFIEAMERCRRREQMHLLPSAICGMSVFVIESEILRFVNENGGEGLIERKLEELSAMVECCSGPGLLVSVGDLKAFVRDDDDDPLKDDLVGGLVRNFTKFLEDHRDRSWLIGCATYEVYLKFLTRFPSVEKDWDLQPLAITSVKHSKSEITFKSSLMGSFVPFAGFFPSSFDCSGMSGSSYQLPTCGNRYGEKHAQVVTAGAGYNSVADHCQTALPSWLRMAEITTSNTINTFKAKNVVGAQGAATLGCHCESDKICQHFHHTLSSPITKTLEEFGQVSSIQGQLNSDKEKAQNFASMVDRQNTESLKLPNRHSKIATDLILGIASYSHSPEKESTVSSDKELSSNCCVGHVDMDNIKSLSDALIRRVGRQHDAVKTISQTISCTRASNGKLKGSRIRGDTWMNLTGADIFGMRRTAMALAEVFTGSKDKLIHIDLINDTDARNCRKTMIDHIADSLSKAPLSVIFLENLELVNPPAQKSLLHAVRNGKFLDSHGREVGISNVIFLLKTRNSPDASCSLEDRIARAKPCPIQITVTTANALNKRKRPFKGSAICLDLNLPAEEGSEDEDDDQGAWLDDLLSEVDATVVFEAFEYEYVSEKLVGLIHGCFSRCFCSECDLEIESRAMEQILAGVCSSGRNGEVEEWLDKVVSRGFIVARERYHLSSHCCVKLDTWSVVGVEEEKPCVWLPSELVLNCQP